MRVSILILAIALAAVPRGAAAIDPMENAAARARQTSDSAALQALQARLSQTAQAQPESSKAQLDLAELYLTYANRLRNERKIRSDLPSDQDKAFRAQQAEWAAQAIPSAESARDLAVNDAERAQAERVLGELYAHRITGMISGMINGPRARRHIGRSLELAPDDPECNRAIGLMYLNNPPFTGGDVPKAVETFTGCAEAIRDDRCLVLLAMAYRKQGNLEAARGAAQAALDRDPASAAATMMLEELQ
ncbi:MAG: hypothetical protein JRH10_09660 [Deltaproteobacteria bacterium]|nr:hypothetical protein [Deltaproteobacteria bacterium]MBW2446893.1 hypothetical protein [Deltaproteobacteria bacterium]